MNVPNGITFPKRCTRCAKPAVNLAQTLCRAHHGAHPRLVLIRGGGK